MPPPHAAILALLPLLTGSPGTEPAASGPEPSKLTVQDADPLGRGAWQVQLQHASGRCTAGWDDRGRVDRHGGVRETLVQAAVTAGLHDRLDLALAAGFARLDDRDEGTGRRTGFADAALGAKWRLGEAAAGRVRWAYLPTLSVPLGRNGLASGGAWLDHRLALTASARRWTATADAGVAHGAGAGQGAWSAGAAVGFEVLPGIQPVVEATWTRDLGPRHEPRTAALAVGLVVTPGPSGCLRAGHARTVRGRASRGRRGAIVSVDLNRPAPTAPPDPGWGPPSR